MHASRELIPFFPDQTLLSQSFPIGDWQFWVVTLLALAALWFVLRSVLPAKLGGKRRGVRKRTTLTISGKLPGSDER